MQILCTFICIRYVYKATHICKLNIVHWIYIDFVWHFVVYKFKTSYHNLFHSLLYIISQSFQNFTSIPRIKIVFLIPLQYHVSQLFSPFHFNTTYHNCFHHSTSIPRITIVFTVPLQYHVSQLFSPFDFNTTYHNCFHHLASIPRITIVFTIWL